MDLLSFYVILFLSIFGIVRSHYILFYYDCEESLFLKLKRWFFSVLKRFKSFIDLCHVCALPLNSPCYMCMYGMETEHQEYPWEDSPYFDCYCSYHPKSKHEWISNLYNSFVLLLLEFFARIIRAIGFYFIKLRKDFKDMKKLKLWKIKHFLHGIEVAIRYPRLSLLYCFARRFYLKLKYKIRRLFDNGKY